ncbi:MAG: N-acetyl-gamma-glutamyl-phosphate reductase [Campylobacterales bacterium]|nr:N-acetyl-gamma-glutamyl-phosphate reductase [Campylobacterales bacterium]
MQETINVAIIGASGYTGLELLKILTVHPRFKIRYVGTSEGGEDIIAMHPSLKNVVSGKAEKSEADAIANVASLAFLALPHQASMGFAKKLLALGVKVIDLSADYRLTQSVYEAHYCPHEDPLNLSHAVYGLPEFYRKPLASASLVANPGCYPTATLLALVPFLPYMRPQAPIIVDAKSGISGAGKKPNPVTQFVSINENMMAYNPLSHRHEPEIKEQLFKHGGEQKQICFVPQLIPVTRGMLVNAYVQLKESIDPIAVLEAYYANEPFVRIRREPVSLKATAGSHFCDIFAKEKEGVLFLSSSIDNLLRGASSQAVVNANIMCGLDEYMGIPTLSYVP